MFEGTSEFIDITEGTCVSEVQYRRVTYRSVHKVYILANIHSNFAIGVARMWTSRFWNV